MQPSHGDLGHKCSCSTCFYKNASESPSHKDMLSGSSKIDKLFLGKYLPMREKKLLDRLVRTRAIYDDIRNQLLADSNGSSDDKPEKHGKNDHGEIDTNSSILQLVNLVDKGATRQSPLSDCCSCCSCDSLFQLQRHPVRGHRAHQHRHSHTGIRQGMRHDHKTTKHREHRDQRIPQYANVKDVRSDPCACKNPRSKELVKRMSRTLSRRSRSKLDNILPPGRIEQEYQAKRASKNKGRHLRGSEMGEAIKQSIKQSITKIKQTKKNIESEVKKSIENINTTKKKIKDSVSGSFRKLVEKTKHNPELEDAELLRLFESTFGIDLSKEEGLDYKKIMEKWACDFECDPEECTPKECFEEKKRSLLKDRGLVQDGIIKKGHLKKLATSGSSETGIQVKNQNVTGVRTGTNKQKMYTENVRNSSTAVDQRVIKRRGKQKETRHHTIEINVKRKDKKAGNRTNKNAETSAIADAKSVQSVIRLPSKSSQVAIQPTGKTAKRKSTGKIQQTLPQAPLKRVSCDCPSVTSVSKVSSKQSQVALKGLKSKKTSKYRPVKTVMQTKENARKHSIESETLPQDAVIKQAPQEYVQRPAEPRVLKTARPTPVTEKTRNIPRTQNERQAVRIGSSFSFNIEFYKYQPDKLEPRGVHSKSPRVHRKNRETRPTLMKIRHKTSSTSQSAKKNLQSGAYNLKRCFCTLKLKPKGIKARSTKTHPQYVHQSFSLTKSMQTIRAKNKAPRQPVLLPYECEPMVCVPGDCDPYECIKLIRKRNFKLHSARTTTEPHHRSKSTPSQTYKPFSSIATETQSFNAVSKSHVSRGDQKNFSHREPVIRLVDENSPKRQAVRIGSTFRFNIDFYKDDPPDQEVCSINTWNPQRRKTLKLEVRPTGRSNKIIGQSINIAKRNISSQQRRIRLTRTPSQVSSAIKSKNASIKTKHSLRRCFCTLKFSKHRDVVGKQPIFSSQKTATSGRNLSSVEGKRIALEKGTKMKKVKNKIILDPNECEPYFCVPGECDPYQCLKRIKMREGIKSKNTGITTTSDKKKSTSSGTSLMITAKNSQVQSNLEVQQPKKRRKRSTYTVSNCHPKSKSEIVRNNTSRHAVSIGSCMSVNIEFFKDKKYSHRDIDRVLQQDDSSPSKAWKNGGDNPNIVRKTTGDNSHTVRKHKSDNSYTTSVIGRESQSSKVEQKNKASGIRRILKRCFCTLKLQNKNRNKKIENLNTRRNETTVMPIQVFYKNINLQENTEKKAYTSNLLSDATRFSSVKQNESKSESIVKKMMNTDINLKRKDLSKTFIKRSFYAMNVQVNNLDRKKYKLRKYECEPGVCIPGECDPLECQNRIMRRLVRKVSTMTSSGNRTKSISSETAGLRSHRKAQKQQFKEYEPRQRTALKSGLQYQTLPKNHRQAVRIGSNFNFNIEFSKDTSGDVASCPKGKPCSLVCAETSCEESHMVTKCVGGCTAKNQDGDTQSGIAMYHKGSMMTAKRKRCFCTLNLLNKKNQYHGFDFNMKGVPPENIIKFNHRGQNTKKHNKHDISNLEPYECEPNVCIPGQCDPYKCLERIKRRNKRINTDIGTGMVPMHPASSLTYYKPGVDKHAQHKTHIRQTRPRRVYKPELVSKCIVQSPPSTRQAVRIGSNFSFEVEFFKNKSATNDCIDVLKSLREQKPRSNIGKTQDSIRVRLSQKSIQDSRVYRNQNEQIETATKDESTKTTSFLKRCFCTAKFFKQQKVSDRPERNTRSPRKYSSKDPRISKPKIEKHSLSFVEMNKIRLKRCFCTLNLYRKGLSKQEDTPAVINNMILHSTDTPDRKINHNVRKSNKTARPLKLNPHECEPGVCFSGECNPYECEKLIKKKLLKESSSSVQTNETQSCSNSTYMTPNKKKNRNAQAVKTHALAKQHERIVHTKCREQVNQGKQAVRIGSNFSFNVEFYKDKSHDTGTHKVITNKRYRYKDHEVGDYNRYINKGITSSQAKLVDRQSQLEKQNTESKGVGPIMKRCFCTLKLQKRGKHQQRNDYNYKTHTKNGSVTANREFKPIYYKNIGTKTRKYTHLEPYECEPGACVPGICNPIECYERIKQRYLRSQNTEKEKSIYECEPGVCIPGECDPYECLERMKRQRKQYKSVCTMCQPYCSPSRCLSTNCDLPCSPAQMQTDKPRVTRKPPVRQHFHQPWQGVKLGSNVSLNIEFYKKKVYPNGITAPCSYENSKPSRMHDKNIGFHDNAKNHSKKYTNTRHGLRNKHMQAHQVNESKPSATGKALKRCFCTAKLHQPGTSYLRNKAFTVGRVHKISTLSPFCKHYCKCSVPKIPKTPTPTEYTVVEISGDEITKSFSVIRNQCEDNRDTTVLHVGGTDLGVNVKREKISRLNTKHKDLEKKKKLKDEKKTTRTQTKCKFANTFTLCQLLNNSGNGNGDNNLENGQIQKQKRKGSNNYESIERDSKYSKNARPQNKLTVNKDNEYTGEYTLVKLSGEDLAKNISVVSDSNRAMPETTLITVGGAEIDCEISRKKVRRVTEDIVESKQCKDNRTLTCTYCKFLKQGADNFNKALNKNAKRKDRHISDNVNLQDNMKTILPYEPKHFCKIKSSTGLGRRRNNKCSSGCLLSSDTNKQANTKYIAAGDYSLTNSQAKTMIKKETLIKRLFCAFFPSKPNCLADVDYKVSKENLHWEKPNDNLRKSKSERKTYYPQSYFDPKKSKSAKVSRDNSITQVIKKRCNRSQPQIANPKTQGYLIEREILCDNQGRSKNRNKRVQFAITPEIDMGKKNGDSRGDHKTKAKYCGLPSCLNPKTDDNYIEVKISGKRLKKDVCASKIPEQKTLVTVSGSYVGCEINKRALKDAVDSCAATCTYCGKFGEKSKPDTYYKFHSNADKKNKVTTKPHKDHTHLHQKDIRKSLHEKDGRQRVFRPKSCRCCICKKKLDAKIIKQKKQSKKKPCLCGSSQCAKMYKKEQAKKASMLLKSRGKKPCVCGSPVCLDSLANSDTMTLIKKGYRYVTCSEICTCKKKNCVCTARTKKTADKKKIARLTKLRKERRVADKIRSDRQRAYDDYMNRRVRKFRKRGNILLWAESALDLSKVGVNVASGATRAVYRTITDPENTKDAMKTIIKQPKKGFIKCRKVYRDTGTPSALNRVKMRFASMPGVKKIKQVMESYGPTNFMAHIHDRDPKLRMRDVSKKRKKKIKKRAPVDFECSLFMASLRKKPCLALYYMCPWFYPHLLSMLNLWKQFTEIILFLLAIAVWSPCLLALELFRMFVCCCLCGA